MITETKPLLAQTADDLMSREILTIPQTMSLRAAAGMLANSCVSGAPVVDGEGRCVGVISAGDFVAWAARGERAAKNRAPEPFAFCSAWQLSDLKELPVDEVRRYMTRDMVTAGPEATIRELACMMVDAHIHRVIVTDTLKRPIGIVSTTDILAALAHSEFDTQGRSSVEAAAAT